MRPRYLMAAVFVLVLSTAPTVAKQLGLFQPAPDPSDGAGRAMNPTRLQGALSTTEAGSARLVPAMASIQSRMPAARAPVGPRAGAAPEVSPVASHASSGASAPPADTEASPPDGLPAEGMRCSSQGGVFQCGACRIDSDCPAGSGCVANRETRRFECMASECEQDAHCFPGLVCRPVTTGATGPVIRRCVLAGTRREGEPCDGLFISQAGACQEGLTCHRGVCSLPCRLGDAASCPQGSVCEEGLNGPACFPDCRTAGCAEGQQCKRLTDTDYQCLSEVNGECPEKPCGEGERCNLRLSRGRGVFWCARLCEPLRADSCPADQVCGVGSSTVSTCYRRCDPMAPDSCDEGWQCTTVTEDMTQWGCSPVSSR